MNRKYFLFILQFLTSICIVSVGFASWTIISGDSITASGAISAKDVNQSEDFISLTAQSELKYYQTGFVIQNGNEYTIGTTGIMSVTYTIHLDKCKEIYTSNENHSLKVRVYLTCNIINKPNLSGSLISLLNEETEICSVEPKVYIEDTEISSNENTSKYSFSYGIENNVSWIEFCLEDILNNSGDYSFKVDYNFTTDSFDTYEEYIYPNLKEFHFESSALINEVR